MRTKLDNVSSFITELKCSTTKTSFREKYPMQNSRNIQKGSIGFIFCSNSSFVTDQYKEISCIFVRPLVISREFHKGTTLNIQNKSTAHNISKNSNDC